MTEDETTHPTLDKFQSETGITVNYQEAVDDNETFFYERPAGLLDAGQPTEWDLVVVTDWMVARLVRLEWLETIDTSLTPNFVENIADNYKGRSFDPDTNMAAPLAVGHDRHRV